MIPLPSICLCSFKSHDCIVLVCELKPSQTRNIRLDLVFAKVYLNLMTRICQMLAISVLSSPPAFSSVVCVIVDWILLHNLVVGYNHKICDLQDLIRISREKPDLFHSGCRLQKGARDPYFGSHRHSTPNASEAEVGFSNPHLRPLYATKLKVAFKESNPVYVYIPL